MGLRIDSIKNAFSAIETKTKVSKYKLTKFEPNVRFSFSKKQYTVKTANDLEELTSCLKLRYDVFHEELLQKMNAPRVDVDNMDLLCDHLMIIDDESQKTIGTYRMTHSLFSDQFYASSEFEIGELFSLEGRKLELGRACIHKDYRNGIVMTLLWRGVSEYMRLTDTNFLFGCASIFTMDPHLTGKICAYLKQKDYVGENIKIQPAKKYEFSGLNMEEIPNLSEEESREIKKLIPPLFYSYLRAGAKIYLPPALDKSYHCVDFFTILDVKKLNPSHSRKYKV